MSSSGEFNSYLGLLTDSGKRSRTILIFIIALVIIEVSVIKNNYYPGWTRKRIDFRARVYDCYQHGNIESDVCKELIKELNVNISSNSPKPECREGRATEDQIKKLSLLLACVGGNNYGYINFRDTKDNVYMDLEKTALMELTKKRVDFLQFGINIVGGVVDINDFWIISGPLMAFLLFFLKQSLNQEQRILTDMNELPDKQLPIMIHSQVLFAFSGSYFRYIIRLLVYMLPTYIYGVLIWDDWYTAIFLRLSVNYFPDFIIWLELFMSALLLTTNFAAWRAQERLIGTVRKLEKNLFRRVNYGL